MRIVLFILMCINTLGKCFIYYSEEYGIFFFSFLNEGNDICKYNLFCIIVQLYITNNYLYILIMYFPFWTIFEFSIM